MANTGTIILPNQTDAFEFSATQMNMRKKKLSE